ncbi:unnamed protein product [Triticum turgidum subsp. durum]|uniref:KIB1-4 beta-propeller domain-containing protein n=1 Tax=Triticum turgidum subsp. durum TaxID=4567 RepID=A0A9R0Q5L3_TRITD|nr:unnamed protein product [Triticum turgidum subsp. durum]
MCPPGTATAGRKRKGASGRPPTGSKRRRAPEPAHEASGWASLPTDIVGLVSGRLLAEDVDYLTFRAVCSGWRASTSDLGILALRKPQLRPHGWIALCDGDGAPLDSDGEITLFNTRTVWRLRIRLPDLRCHRVVSFTDGLVILLHKRITAVRVVHPFTLATVQLPPLAPAFRNAIKDREALFSMSAFVCSSPTAPFSVVARFPWRPMVLWTQPSRLSWEVIHHGMVELQNFLPFQGLLFAITKWREEIVMVYPPRKISMAYYSLADPSICREYLVEVVGRMMLVLQHGNDDRACPKYAFRIFEVDIWRQKLLPICNLGSRALFLNTDRCLCVPTMSLPSLYSNSVHFSVPSSPAVMHSLSSGLSEDLAALCRIHDMKEETRPSVRPFTIADHLLTYCNHMEWARGLMFHEYHHIPDSFEELKEKIKAQCSQVHIPRTGTGGSKAKLCHI